MRKRLLSVLLAITVLGCTGLSGCSGNGSDQNSRQEQDEDDEDDEDKDEDDEDEKPSEETSEENGIRELDYDSSDSILEFAVGTWTLVDQSTGSPYGILEINENGDCKYTQDFTNKQCEGTISFVEDPADRLPGIHGYLIDFGSGFSGSDPANLGNSSSGRFMISQSAGTDYLFMEELGNGASNVVYEIFNSPDWEPYDYELNTQWIFVRDNEVESVEAPLRNAKFYARAMEFTGEGLVLQKVIDVDFESEYEYTYFKFLGAVFDESSYQGAAYYNLNADADLSGVLHETSLKSAYPEAIYTVYTDSEGNIEAIRDVEKAYFGEYELYSLEQNIDYDFDTFSVNGAMYYIHDYVSEVANSIVECEVFGDDLIITSHVNPHAGIYTIFDMRDGWPEKNIEGCNLIYDEHIWDSFYSYMDTVYDYEGRVIYTVDGAEISSLYFTDDGKHIKIEYWKSDYEDTYEETIDRPECLNAPTYALADFRRHPCAYTWENFISYAPEDAIAMIMVNPHADNSWDFHMPMTVEDEMGLDIVYAVALQDRTLFGFGNAEDELCDRGELVAYNVTVSEGIPRETLIASTVERQAKWPAMIISGKDDIRYIFI
ncbi:MAG: hypothetical protein J5476_09945 [Lachnospiraceae bacterium]|nr:hypothetical protein [Lachnospiraceae bacterium]